MQVVRKNLRVDQISCEGDLADIQAQLDKFVEKPTEAGIGVVLELFPIVVKSNQRGKFKVVAGHRSFLLARSRLTADEKIPVSELVGKGDDSELFGPAYELFGALFFTQSAESLAARVEPYKNDRSLALVARDLSAPKHFDEIFKESGPKKRMRRTKAKEELQDGSEEQLDAPEHPEGDSGPSNGTPGAEAEQSSSEVATGPTAAENPNTGDSESAPGDPTTLNASDALPAVISTVAARVVVADPAPGVQPKIDGTTAEASLSAQPVVARRRGRPPKPKPLPATD